MERRQIGKTELSVTVLGFCGAPLGNLYAPVGDAAAQASLEAAWAAGRRLFDTAPFYGYGLSERRGRDALPDLAPAQFGRLAKARTRVGRGRPPHKSRVR